MVTELKEPESKESEALAPVLLPIPTCGDCPFVDHSGAFTPGGAKSICGHKNASDTFAAGIVGDDHYHWKHRVISRESAPPPQCPLRRTEDTNGG